jgi:hypothetical protein
MREAIPPLPNTPSWRGAQLKKAQEEVYLYLTENYVHPCNARVPTVDLPSRIDLEMRSTLSALLLAQGAKCNL